VSSSPTLFDMSGTNVNSDQYSEWRPDDPPILNGAKEIIIDYETTGLRWWDGHRAIGVSYYIPADGRTGYLPYRHKQGPNIDEAVMIRWHKEQLKDVRITNANTRFEVHIARNDGVDLEEQGCQVSDVQHYAALLDDHRRKFSLEKLCEDFLSDEVKVKTIDGVELDPTRMQEYHPGMVAVRGMADVRQVHKLKEVMWPRLDAEDLQRVRQLEDDIIYPVCEMEKNAQPVDVTKLKRWRQEAEEEHMRCLYRMARTVGFQVNPDSGKSMARLFQHLGIPITSFTPVTYDEDGTKRGGAPSFTAAVLDAINHPVIEDVKRAGRLADVLSKALVKYDKTISQDGLLRYALHQLRSDEGGTISGRFSSSAFTNVGEDELRSVGANIQQVMAVSKQRVQWGFDEDDDSHDEEIYAIKELFIPGNGLFLESDAAQIEYRIFASRAGTPKVLEAYAKNPWLKFHHLVWEMLKPYKPDLTYKHQKNLNFAYVYGAGLAKIALMMGFITEQEFTELHRQYPKGIPSDHPKLATALQIKRIYEQQLPEVPLLLQRAAHLAKSQCDDRCNRRDELHAKYPHQGFVRTVMGRRMRFPNGNRLHKALNGVIQGDGAEINKTKIVELHRARKYTGLKMRMTVHDAITGDVPDAESARRVDEVLNRQSFTEFQVPILWETKTGNNWAKVNPLSRGHENHPRDVPDATRPGSPPVKSVKLHGDL
jgi:DNA polymerase I-like protein with 3'-5' exonuclease and polymerase domains